ncbi:MAG: AAA family ATPase [Lactobacillus sp.]|jgi:type III restriction enzyme|nr:AAA family ATPase [Lactobacillus sp.]
MDKGAHFHKCDFQVHTPRDINWNGDRPVTEDNRKIYATEFIKQCRKIGLNAVAITDHHDFAFYPIIKEAAENELDDNGISIPKEKRIIIFPGLEMTFSTPACQAILILDADYPQNNLNQILHLFGITPTQTDASTTAQTIPITNTNIAGFDDLYKTLNTIDLLRGRFIVLPNLSEGGHHTLFRAGNSEHYRKMPCVGGYLDGNVSQHGTGNQNIVKGADRNWGYKSVALFQTSDNRQRDFGLLGTHSTYVKWAEPTAEALRQACLAKESRLSQEEPSLPQIYISRIDVTNSKFMGSFAVEFNQQYSALIGGRGTGKSTILEYLRWGLCDQASYGEDEYNVGKRSQSLIEKTLVFSQGEVRVQFVLNGITHIVKRNSISKEILLKIGSDDFRSVKEEDIRQILPIQAYSQKQLSNVGVRAEELKRFIHMPIMGELNNLRFQIADNANKTKGVYNNYIRRKELEKEVAQFNLETISLNEQISNLRKSLVGLSKIDQEIIAKKYKVDNENILIKNVELEISNISVKIEELFLTVSAYPESIESNVDIENKDLFNSLLSTKTKKIDEIKTAVNHLRQLLIGDNIKDFNESIAKIIKVHDDFNVTYEEAKGRASSNQSQLNEIRRIEERIKEISNLANEKNIVMKSLGVSDVDFLNLRKEWFVLHKKKALLLNNQTQNFSSLSKGLIKVEVLKNIDKEQIKVLISGLFQGTRTTAEKIQALCDTVYNADEPLDTWNLLLEEIRILAEVRKLSNENSFTTPILTRCEFTENNKAKLIESLTPEKCLNVATTEIEFNPVFKYLTNNQMGDEIPFSDASAGQQATALLTVLLNQNGGPLIIDQPEDDIDNRAIEDIVNNIWEAKKCRQLIFTSHNANLVVNGDAELVICCDYKDSSDQTRGGIKIEGAIDKSGVKDEITSIMEGGEKAFRLRKDKYGF